MADRRQGQPSRGRRRGVVFSVRVTDAERAQLAELQAAGGGPRSLGAWLKWRALDGRPPPRAGSTRAWVVPGPGAGTTRPGAAVLPELEAAAVVPDLAAAWSGTTAPAGYYPRDRRLILDLCAGSGSWSEPYERAAGYEVIRVTLPGGDVRTFVPPVYVWGVLAAPPCPEFSLARNARPELPRDFVRGMECVNACLRIVLQCRPRWWALENPAGYLSQFLGTPRDVWEPYEFGDAHTKRTAIWGDYQIPTRGPFVAPIASAMDRPTAADRAITPPGFARAFFEANP